MYNTEALRKKRMNKIKTIIRERLQRYVTSLRSKQEIDSELHSLLLQQVNKKSNISACLTNVFFAEKQNDSLNIRLTIYLDGKPDIAATVHDAIGNNMEFPYKVGLNAHYLAYTRSREPFLFFPTVNTSLNFGVISNPEDYGKMLDQLKSKDEFISELINHHERVLAIDDEGRLFQRSDFSFLRLVSLECYIKYSNNFFNDYHVEY